MSPLPSTTELPAQGPDAVERRGRHLRMLAELAEIGMELVREVRVQALEEVPAGRLMAADPVLSFARLARAVRQTVALEAKVAVDGFASAQPASRGATRPGAAVQPGFVKMKARIRRSVEEAIASGAEPGDAEDLLRDLDERLDDPEYAEEMGDRPFGMIVALICGGLGVKIDLKDFTDTELGFDREDMKAAVRAARQAALDAAAVSGSREDDAAEPVWRPRGRTGLDPP